MIRVVAFTRSFLFELVILMVVSKPTQNHHKRKVDIETARNLVDNPILKLLSYQYLTWVSSDVARDTSY